MKRYWFGKLLASLLYKLSLWIPIFIQPCFSDWPSIPFDLWSVLSPKKQHFWLLFRFNDGKLNFFFFLISESHSFLVADESPKTHFVFYFDLSFQVLTTDWKEFCILLACCVFWFARIKIRFAATVIFLSCPDSREVSFSSLLFHVCLSMNLVLAV